MEKIKLKINRKQNEPPVELEVTVPCYRKSKITLYKVRRCREDEYSSDEYGLVCDGIVNNNLFLEMSCAHSFTLAFTENTREATEHEWQHAKNEVLTKLSQRL